MSQSEYSRIHSHSPGTNPLIVYGNFNYFFSLYICRHYMYSICHSSAHSFPRLIATGRTSESSLEFTTFPMLVSSANMDRIFSSSRILMSKLLLYIMKNIGPRIDPWGTPESTGSHSEAFPFKITLCSLPVSQFISQFSTFPFIPCTLRTCIFMSM